MASLPLGSICKYLCTYICQLITQNYKCNIQIIYKTRVCYVIMYIVLKLVHTRYLQEELFRRMQPSTFT